MEIIGAIQKYDWGKLGASSEVAKLAKLNSAEFQVIDGLPYAELWMGDHPNGPSKLKSNGEPLRDVLGNEKLPFLFKVLSIRKALSIQVHPNKNEAERLHQERPDIYKDSNHKPELAIALTPFTAICGFRPYSEIIQLCEDLPPLKKLLGGEAKIYLLRNDNGEGLKQCYSSLLNAPISEIEQCINMIVQDYEHILADHNLLDVFHTVKSDFPNDVGVLSLFFLNLIRLQPGEAIFLAANEIHAYLSGDCIECMACSDNVIRAGLTPKYKDVQELLSSLNFKGAPPSEKLFQPHIIDVHIQLFVPPVDDFAVAAITLPANMSECKLQIKPYGSILIVLEGECKLRTKMEGDECDLALQRGSIVFIPAAAAPEIKFLTNSTTKNDFKAYMAMPNYFKS